MGEFKTGSRRREEADFGSKTLPPPDVGGYGFCDDSWIHPEPGRRFKDAGNRSVNGLVQATWA